MKKIPLLLVILAGCSGTKEPAFDPDDVLRTAAWLHANPKAAQTLVGKKVRWTLLVKSRLDTNEMKLATPWQDYPDDRADRTTVIEFGEFFPPPERAVAPAEGEEVVLKGTIRKVYVTTAKQRTTIGLSFSDLETYRVR